MKRLISLILYCLMMVSTYASTGLIFKNIDVKSGLSDNYVKGIVRDRYGFMWFATVHGLDRYDGYMFKRYSLGHLGDYSNYFASVKEDGDGVLWIQSPHNIYIYNRATDKIEDKAKEQFAKLGINDSIIKLYIDEAQNLWAISSKHIYFYDFNTKALDKIIIQTPSKIIDITAQGRSAYAYMADGKFYRIDLNVHRLKYEGEIELSAYNSHYFYLDKSGLLWFYTIHSPADPLLCYSTRGRYWKNIPALSVLNNVILTYLIDDGRGNIWIGTENEGVYIYNRSHGQVEVFSREENNEFSLACNHISVFYKDSRNTMWIGSGKQGVSYAYLDESIFQTVRLKGKEDVSCLVEDTNENLWIGFDGGGLTKISKDGNATYYYKGNGGLPTNLVTCSLIDKNGRLWIGTYGEGVLYLDNNKFVKLAVRENYSGAVYIRTIAEDDQGNLWIGTIDKGLLCYRKDGDVDVFTYENSDLRTNSITCLTCDNKGYVYIGTTTGFCIYDNRKGVFLTKPSALDIFTDAFVTSVHKDARGLVWIGCREGLNVLDESTGQVYSITEANGLSHSYVRAIMEDTKGNIWVSTDKGLNNIRTLKDKHGKYTFRSIPYFREDGLGNVTFCNNATCLTTQGECLIGCTNGFLRIRKKGEETARTASNVVFSSLFIGNRLVEVDDNTGALDCNLQLKQSISLSYIQNNFSVEVSAMNYGKEHRLHYQYRLKEIADEWISITGNVINFNALASGTYTLEVRAVDYSGWQSDIATLSIRVLPPIWRSWPAFIVYLLLACCLAYLYLRRMKKKHQETLAIQKLEMELEQQHQIEKNKMRFFTDISHDLKTPLTLIITPLEKLLSGTLDNSVRQEMELVWRNAKTLMDEVTQLLDFRRLDAGSEELHVSHGDMVEFVRRTVSNFKYYSDNKGISLDLKINTSELEMNFDQTKMRRVITNLLSNAFKYNKPNGCVCITLDKYIQAGSPFMQLTIADTGIGIKPENKKRIFERFYQEKTDGEYIGSGIGLHIVKEYVALQHGEISVEDNHPEGSIFIVTIPITQTETDDTRKDNAPIELVPDNSHEKPQEHKANILIVEDNTDFRQFLERCLNDQYDVLTAGNGVEALQQLEKHQTDIVITDVMMPEMNGMELCNKIKTDLRYSHIPVIMLTAKSTDDNIIAGLKDGADEYITKPFNLSILKLRIQKILEWTEANHRNFGKSVDIAPSEITVSSIDEELIEKAIKVVEQNMNDSDFSVEDFSAAVGMTRGHLYKKLMAITGKSPLEFIRTIRIKRGKALLEQGRTNVSEVAYSVGFSPKQFAKYFKEEYGSLPSEFIRK